MFTIDFTKPWLYKDIIYFNQGNLSTNNTLRCKLVTGGSDDFTGGSIACTFTTKDSVEISGFGKLVDAKNGIIDIVFPSNSLVVGNNKLEVLVNRADGGVAQSPPVMYDIWQGLTTGNGVAAETNYPILIELINSVNEASNKANATLDRVNAMQTDVTDAIDNAYRSANDADIATSNANTKIEEVENAKVGMINKVDTEIANMKTQVNASTDTMTSKVDMKIADVDSAIASGTKDLEVKESRRDMDGVEHDTLKLRLESDLKKGKVIEETKEGTYLSFNDTVGGIVSDIEVLGNTVQDAINLANIKSSCIANGDGTYKMSILSCGENLFDGKVEIGGISNSNGANASVSDYIRSIDFIPVNKNTAYVCKNHGYDRRIYSIYFYRSDKTYISYKDLASVGESFTTPNDCKFVRFVVWESNPNLSNYSKIKLQEGTVATPYTPYEETRCDIKLPCQLEKVGDVADRLYYDKEENAWCVDKAIGTVVFDGTESWGIGNIVGNTIEGTLQFKDVGVNKNINSIEMKFVNTLGIPSVSLNTLKNSSTPCISGHTSNYILIRIVGDSSTFKSSIKGVSAKYIKATPQKIVLPKSEQSILNSFLNKTFIKVISGEVDATVKATVSKSLASTVQANTNEINNLSSKIADIEGLKETQDFSYETDKGYLVCKDTQNGVVKDLKLYGKSLINKYPKLGGINVTTSQVDSWPKLKMEWGGTTTVVNCSDKTILINFNRGADYVTTLTFNPYEVKKINYDSEVSISQVVGQFKSGWSESNKSDLQKILVFQGDIINPPVTYFEGIASVGNGNEIEVSSIKSDGNLFDSSTITKGKALNTNGTDTTITNENAYISDFIRCFKGIKYNTNRNQYGTVWNLYDKDRRFVKQYTSTKVLTADIDGFLKVHCVYTDKTPEEFMINIGDKDIDYKPFKQDKKPISFKDVDNTWKPVTELRGIDLNSCDTIEKHSDGKHYLHVRTEKLILNGGSNENWIKSSSERPNHCIYVLNGVNVKLYSKCLSSRFNYDKLIWEKDVAGVTVGDKRLDYFVPNTINTLELWKQNLQQNNETVIILREKELIYEVNPLEVESFDNETMILIDGGAISPKASFKITSSLANFVQNVEDRVCRLENEVYKMNLANFAVALNTLDMKTRLEALETPTV